MSALALALAVCFSATAPRKSRMYWRHIAARFL
jgi:hypothetical protein